MSYIMSAWHMNNIVYSVCLFYVATNTADLSFIKPASAWLSICDAQNNDTRKLLMCPV